MADPLVPSNYEEAKRCVTLLCGIPLTARFIDKKLRVQKDPSDLAMREWAA